VERIMELHFKNGWWKVTQDTRNYIISKRYKAKNGEFQWEPLYYFTTLEGVAGKLFEMEVLEKSLYTTIVALIKDAKIGIRQKLEEANVSGS
jgi:hypothetical protein